MICQYIETYFPQDSYGPSIDLIYMIKLIRCVISEILTASYRKNRLAIVLRKVKEYLVCQTIQPYSGQSQARKLTVKHNNRANESRISDYQINDFCIAPSRMPYEFDLETRCQQVVIEL